MNSTKNKLYLILSMVIFGTIGMFRKFIPLPSGMLAMARGFIGTASLLAIVYLRGSRLNAKVIKANALKLCLSGALIGFNWILLFEAYRYTTVATATLCYYMAPIFVFLASPFLFREKLGMKKVLCIAVALVGMVLVSGILEADFGGSNASLGILMGLGAALLYASVIVMNKRIVGVNAYDKTIVQLFSAAVVVLPYTLLMEDVASVTLDGTGIIMLLVVGVIHTGITYALYFGSIDSLSTQTVALCSYIDPVVAIFISAFVLMEDIGPMGIIGAVLVLGSTMLSELNLTKKKE
ncbi:MAG: DMT family transporter [Clostridiales bacterium]|nr:DMT family transporter [Clostridiales bacterium]